MVSSIIACIIQCITSFWPVYPNNLFMRLLCFLYHLCSQVVLLGDLNYRISLEGAETRSLVKAKNWAILLENDQVYFLCQISSTCHLNHFLKILNAVVSLSFNRSYYLSSLGGGISRGGKKGWSRSPHLQVPPQLRSVLLVLRWCPGREEACTSMVSWKAPHIFLFLRTCKKKNALSNRYLNRAAVQLLSHTLNLVNGMICGAVNVTSDRGVYLCAGVIVFSGGARDWSKSNTRHATTGYRITGQWEQFSTPNVTYHYQRGCKSKRPESMLNSASDWCREAYQRVFARTLSVKSRIGRETWPSE